MKNLETYWKWDSNTLSLIEDMKKTPQSKIHHAEGDVYLHTQMVLNEVEKGFKEFHSPLSRKILGLTAVLHDIAKPKTTIWEDNDWRSPGHAKLGEKMSRQILWNSLDYRDREEVASLIKYHGLPIWFQEKENPEMSIIESSLRCNNEELAYFAECDFKGRICSDLFESLFKIEMYKEKAFELNCLNKPFEFTSDWARLHYFKNGGYQGKEIWEPKGALFTVMVGLPGSGKNTWVEKNWSSNVIELDVIRKKFKIKPTDKDAQGYVANIAKEELRESLRKKEDILWNATNITEQQRNSIINLALQYDAKIRIVYIDCPIEKVIQQNKQREAQIPTESIKKLFNKLEMPNTKECHFLEIVDLS